MHQKALRKCLQEELLSEESRTNMEIFRKWETHRWPSRGGRGRGTRFIQILLPGKRPIKGGREMVLGGGQGQTRLLSKNVQKRESTFGNLLKTKPDAEGGGLLGEKGGKHKLEDLYTRKRLINSKNEGRGAANRGGRGKGKSI